MNRQNRKINTLEGNGKVYKDGTLISNVSYTIQVWQEFIDNIPSYKEIRGQITILDGEKNLAVGSIMTLKLEDDQEWQFYAKSGGPVTRVYDVRNVSGGDLTG